MAATNIVQDPSILAAAKSAIEVMLSFKGTPIALVPNKIVKTPKPGGGHDFPNAVAGIAIDAQLFALSKVGADIVDQSNNDDGRIVLRNYILTARFDAEIDEGDTWEDDEANYVVDTVDSTSGYKTTAAVIAYVKL